MTREPGLDAAELALIEAVRAPRFGSVVAAEASRR